MRLALLLLLLAAGCAAPLPPAEADRCVAPGAWVDDTGRPIDAARLMRRDAGAAVVALGESHDSAEDHRWQLQALAGLYAVNPRLAIGMEMFPRRLQPVLDRWTAGELDEAAFLRLAEWDRVWGFDAQLYLPLLHFARMHRLPLVALNVDRALTARVAREGWAAVPPAERQGVSDPAPVTPAYRQRLADIAAGHSGGTGGGAAFERFVAAQSLWDRAMAEAAASAHRRDGRTVALILGRGHVQYRDGVIHQLAALGIDDSRVWLPWRPDEPCNAPDGAVADALFGMAAADIPPPAPPRLGVEIEPVAAGLLVRGAASGSPAAAAGLRRGDVLTAAAGVPLRQAGDLTGLLRRTPPGIWLPLTVQRGGATRQVVAKLPPPPAAQ